MCQNRQMQIMNSLKVWSDKNKAFYERKGVHTVNFHIDEYSAYVDHETNSKIGRIIVNSEGHLEIEIFEISSGIKLMHASYYFQKVFNEDVLVPYISILLEN